MTEYGFDTFMPIGDHCGSTDIVVKMEDRKASYAFDWFAASGDQLYGTTLHYVMEIFTDLLNTPSGDLEDHVDQIIIKTYFQDYDRKTFINSRYNLIFPHLPQEDTFEKKMEVVKRRLIRTIKMIRSGSKILYMLLSRCHTFDIKELLDLRNLLYRFNDQSRIMFASGVKYPQDFIDRLENHDVYHEYVYYDSNRFYAYDYPYRVETRKTVIRRLTKIRNDTSRVSALRIII